MSGLVRPAEERDIDAAVALLHERMNAKIPPERWRRLLDYPWRPEGVERGWLVEDRGRIVGFMGTVYSDRMVAGAPKRFCDLSSWYLLSDYRGDGTGDALLQAGMAQPGVTYQTMTARRATGRKIRALGFSILDETRSLYRPQGAAAIPVERDPDVIRARLSEPDRRSFDLHRDFDVHHALVGEAGVWIVWQRKLKGDSIAYHEILHAADPGFLSAHAQGIAEAIVSGERGVLAVDSRWISPGDDAGAIEAIPLPRWHRPAAGVGARDVDHLYSEVILLDQKLP
ncbi:N-acetyltransferase family protein [Jiella sp. M17.18]|uniref:GNAT family N-acetyltransferase n=1 Tax=Jiella sp. M17.18 TaxID=3234247 RepID=UPI0034DEF167